jgi:predicted dehydrogenase
VTLVPRDIAGMSADASRLSFLPAGHPQGYADCFDLFVADAHAAARGEAPADGMPLFADGLRSAQIVEAVLCSAREQRWVDVPVTTPTEVGS